MSSSFAVQTTAVSIAAARSAQAHRLIATARHHRAERLQGAIVAVAVRIATTVKHWHWRARTRDELRSLDERALRDVGLTRADVLRETDKWRWQA